LAVLRGKPEKEANISRAKLQNQSSILEYAIVLCKRAGLIALVHVYVMDALDCAKLAIDRPWVGLLAGFREFGSKCRQLATLITQLLQIGEQYVLQIIVGTGPVDVMATPFGQSNKGARK
jgi:hypothetical protein